MFIHTCLVLKKLYALAIKSDETCKIYQNLLNLPCKKCLICLGSGFLNVTSAAYTATLARFPLVYSFVFIVWR